MITQGDIWRDPHFGLAINIQGMIRAGQKSAAAIPLLRLKFPDISNQDIERQAQRLWECSTKDVHHLLGRNLVCFGT